MTTLVCGQQDTLGSTVTALLGNSYAAKQITLPRAALLTSLSIFVNTLGGNLTLGLYTNGNATKPAQLMATTASTAMGANLNTLNVITPIYLPAGGYWIAFQTDSNTAIINAATAASGIGYNYALAYGAFDQVYNAAPTASTTFMQAFATFTMGADARGADAQVNQGPPPKGVPWRQR